MWCLPEHRNLDGDIWSQPSRRGVFKGTVRLSDFRSLHPAFVWEDLGLLFPGIHAQDAMLAASHRQGSYCVSFLECQLPKPWPLPEGISDTVGRPLPTFLSSFTSSWGTGCRRRVRHHRRGPWIFRRRQEARLVVCSFPVRLPSCPRAQDLRTRPSSLCGCDRRGSQWDRRVEGWVMETDSNLRALGSATCPSGPGSPRQLAGGQCVL